MGKKVTIDLRNIHTPRAAQAYIQYAMDFPAHYGRNLDALHDMLGEIGEEMQLTLITDAQPTREMAAYYGKLLRVLEDAAKENLKLTVL